MSNRTCWWIAAGQIGFVGFLGLAVALHPGFVLKADEGGVSNYGVHLRTTVPYTLAFLLAAGGSLMAAESLPDRDPDTRWLRVILITYSALLVLTLVSTYGYTLNEGLRRVHLVAGAAILLFEAGASVWMGARRRSPFDTGVLVVQLLGSMVAGLTALGVFHLLFLGQAVAASGFGVLLVRTGMATPSATRSTVTSEL